MKNPVIRLSALVLTVFQNFQNIWREAKPHKNRIEGSKNSIPETLRPLWSANRKAEMQKNRVYPSFTFEKITKHAKIES